MKRANRPIISFIHSASKKVRNNKLCQVYLNGVRSKGFRPDILFCNFPKTNFIIYNPQNEMFATFQTKRYFIQNETSSKK